MDPSEFPGNHGTGPSKAARKQEQEAPKVLKIEGVGKVIQRKKPLSRKISETFFGGNAQHAASAMVFDVMIPATKDAIADAITQGIERMLWGEVRSRSRRREHGRVDYHRLSTSRRDPRDRRDPREDPRGGGLSRRSRAQHNFDEIILETRAEAIEVIDQLEEHMDRYGEVTVADMYNMVGISPKFTDERWGWTDLRNADVIRVRDGYLLDLPRPEPVN